MIVTSKRVWRLGDNVDTDLLAPGAYMKGPIEEMAKHCLEALVPEFAETARPGDVIVAGKNFGMGSSREQAVQVLQLLGIEAVVAPSYGRIFYRNALNLALPVAVCDTASEIVETDVLEIDVGAGRIADPASGAIWACDPIPSSLLDMMEDGGLIPHLEKRFQREKAEKADPAG